MSPTSRSKLDFVLSRKPMVRPPSSRGSAGTASASSGSAPMGLKTRMRVIETSSGSGRASPGVVAEADRAAEETAERAVQLAEDRAFHSHRDRFHRLGTADTVDHQRPCELLGALVGGRQAAQRKHFPGVTHGGYLTPGHAR